MSTEHYQEHRCNCGKLLFRSPGFVGTIEIKCRRCGQIKTFSISDVSIVSKPTGAEA